MRSIAKLALASSLASTLACSDEPASGDPFADAVVSFAPAADASFGHERMPDIVLGPPGGPLDVAALGCEGEIVLELEDGGIVDGPGVDLIVFENPFDASFPEPGEVAISDDGQTWWVFACDPLTLDGCAGVTPTGSLEHPTDPERAGGDAFDLAELEGAPTQAWFVRIRDRSREHWQALGMDWCDPGQMGSGGFDLDAVVAIHE